MLENVSIVGSGSWATALVKVFSESGICVHWLVHQHANPFHEFKLIEKEIR